MMKKKTMRNWIRNQIQKKKKILPRNRNRQRTEIPINRSTEKRIQGKTRGMTPPGLKGFVTGRESILHRTGGSSMTRLFSNSSRRSRKSFRYPFLKTIRRPTTKKRKNCRRKKIWPLMSGSSSISVKLTNDRSSMSSKAQNNPVLLFTMKTASLL